MKRIMRTFEIKEISCVDKPAQKGARAMIIKNADPDVPNFGKAAETEWDAALSVYAKRHSLSHAAATLEFANTAEANEIYKRSRLTPRSDAMAKVAAIGNVSAEVLAKAAYPNLTAVAAMNAWLETAEGQQFYSDDVEARRDARKGVA